MDHPNSAGAAVTTTVTYIATSSGIMVPVRFVRREEHEGPFGGLFYRRGFDDLPAADDRGTKRARDGAALQQLKEVAAAAGDECAICLHGFRAEETARAMPACAHAFHQHCISEWLRRNPICPLCRRGLPEEDDDDEVEEEDWEDGGIIICDWEEEEEEVDDGDERRTRRRIISSDDIST